MRTLKMVGAAAVLVLLLGATCGEGTTPAPGARGGGGGGVISASYHAHWTGARVHNYDVTVTVVSSRHAPQVWHVPARERSFAGHVDLVRGDFITVTASQLESGGLYLDLTTGNGSVILDAPKQREDPGAITVHYARPGPNQAEVLE